MMDEKMKTDLMQSVEDVSSGIEKLQKEEPGVLAALLAKRETSPVLRKAAIHLLGEIVPSLDLNVPENLDTVIALGLAACDGDEDLAGPARGILERLQFKGKINMIQSR
ncbi:MAG TPA: hypothetical protein DD727_09535, partial [Clostridiales bacterium]|nr:hypothetical protein [Clostridiales bacterium]